MTSLFSCAWLQLPFPITTPFTVVAVALLQSLESKSLQTALEPCTDTLSGSGHGASPGTKVQPFPHSMGLAGSALPLAEDLQCSLAGIHAWGHMRNIPPLSPKGSALS